LGSEFYNDDQIILRQFKLLKENNLQPRIFYPAGLSFSIRRRDKEFPR